ncbi:Elongator subunit elp6 [Desmophyllum pertusum]|uniref:Elongator complex protein 6 n=1 Tax=Desmophyllum pertusum TaxID=174260 RepID=A0A9W9ZLA7_9CNID|nr:Elongator subunit elp6 [Desmophyllum pertusum]
MFADLNALTDFSEKCPPKRKFLLISDSQNDGSFLIHHFLALYIKGGFKVFFVALVQSFSHYNIVAQKLGANLGSACESGQVTFLDGLKLVSEGLDDKSKQEYSFEKPQTTVSDNNGDDSNPFLNISNHNFTLQPLYNRIKSSLGKETKPCLLLIDDVTALLSIGIHVQEVISFIHYCSVMMCSSPTTLDGCLVTLAHNDSDVDDEESLLLWKQLCYVAHMEFHVKGLSSGYCKDVHGQLTITHRDQNSIKHSSKVVQYKIHEKNVTCFAPGMSKGCSVALKRSRMEDRMTVR